MILLKNLRHLILMLISLLLVIAFVLVVIFIVTLFFAISGYFITFETWDQFMPSKDTVLETVLYHYLGYFSMGFAFWLTATFSGIFFPKSPNFGKNVFIIGLSFMLFLNILVRCFFI